jgi:CHASE3 domain sensor protein
MPSRIGRGWLRLWREARPRAGGRSLAATLGVGLIATALVIVGLAELQRHQQQAARWVDHELEALNAVARFERDMDAAASEARGYLIDARPDRLQWFEAAARRVQGDLPDLRSVIAEDPAQQATLARLEPLVAARMDVLRYAIARQQAHDVDSMALLRRAQTGQEIMAQIFAATGDLRAEERRLLDRRSSGARHEARLMVLGLTISELLSAASGFVAWMLLVSRHREQRHLAEMRQLNLELEERVHARTAELRQLNAELEERVLARTAELAASEARQSAYLRHLADGLLVIRVEPDGRFVCESVNTAAAVMLGLDEAAGGEQREVALKAALGQMETYLRRSMAELGPMRYGSEAGGPRELRFVVAPVQDTPDADHPKGRVGLLLVSVRDMTYEAGLEAKLRSAQRMDWSCSRPSRVLMPKAANVSRSG